jgi:hypothetical protein
MGKWCRTQKVCWGREVVQTAVMGKWCRTQKVCWGREVVQIQTAVGRKIWQGIFVGQAAVTGCCMNSAGPEKWCRLCKYELRAI